MAGWKSEDEIKSQIRELTAETRKLRQDLAEMVRASETKPERRYLHKHSWPKLTNSHADDKRKKKRER